VVNADYTAIGNFIGGDGAGGLAATVSGGPTMTGSFLGGDGAGGLSATVTHSLVTATKRGKK
jgi:hypothetical protein